MHSNVYSSDLWTRPLPIRAGGNNPVSREIILAGGRGLLDDGGLEEPCSFQVKVSNNAGIFAHSIDYSYWSNGFIMGTVG